MAIPIVHYGTFPKEDTDLIEKVFHEAAKIGGVNSGLVVITHPPPPSEVYYLNFTGFKGFRSFTMLSFKYPVSQYGSVDQKSLNNKVDFDRTVQYLADLIIQTPNSP